MTKKHASKFKRKSVRPIRLTERDQEIIMALHKYRFLTTDHLQTLTNTKSRWGMNARLRLLYDHKYIDRPKAQFAIFSHAAKRPIIYAIGHKGASLLLTRYGLKMPAKTYWTEKNRRVREKHIEHTLGVSDFMVGVETMCREQSNLIFIDPDTILARSPVQTRRAKYPFRWKTTIEHNGQRHNISIVPDFVFGIKDTNSKSWQNEKFYFVEIDRGTMPVERSDITQTSFVRKALSYADTLERNLALNRFKITGFQVLTVTTSEKRVKAIQTAINGLSKKSFSANTFLFRPKDKRQTHFHFQPCWTNLKGRSCEEKF